MEECDLPSLRICYADSSAILCWFNNEKGADIMKRVCEHNIGIPIQYSLNISSTIQEEVNKKLCLTYSKQPYKIELYKTLLTPFIVANEQMDPQRLLLHKKFLLEKYPPLQKQHNSQDADIINELIYCLGFLVGESHPILISCDKTMIRIVKKEGYQVFDPKINDINDFIQTLNSFIKDRH